MAKMRSKKVSEAQRVANDKYDAKTYKMINFRLRIQEDADIIEAIESAKVRGNLYESGFMICMTELMQSAYKRNGCISS